MAILNTIRTAVLTDLRVLKASGFDIVLAEVYDEPIDPAKAVYPHAELSTPESIESEPATLSNRQNDNEAFFLIRARVKSANPMSDLLDACDSIKNVLQRSAAGVAAIAGVYQVDVIRPEPAPGAEETHGKERSAELALRVAYFSQRGSE